MKTLIVYDFDGTPLFHKTIPNKKFLKSIWSILPWSLNNITIIDNMIPVVEYSNKNRSPNYKVALISNRCNYMYSNIKNKLKEFNIDIDYILLKDGSTKFSRLYYLLKQDTYNKVIIYENNPIQINHYEMYRPVLEYMNIEYIIINVNNYKE